MDRPAIHARPGVASRAASHARAWVLAGLCSVSGCTGESVDARAIWIDGYATDGTRRVHVYDRGQRYTFEVLGETEPAERVRLGPRGRGLLIRAGQRSGAWFSLDDGRRLPLLIPPSIPGALSVVRFSERGDALSWFDEVDDSLRLVPLAPGLELEREDDGSAIPLHRPGALDWIVSSRDAPVLLVGHSGGGASFLRYPDEQGALLAVVAEATVAATPLSLPTGHVDGRTCVSKTMCYTNIGLSPDGELGIVSVGADPDQDNKRVWYELDSRSAQVVSELELPEPLETASANGGLGLLAVLDRSVSVWLGAVYLYRWDRAAGIVDSVPVFAAPPLFWFPVERGRALVLLSTTGPMYRVDIQRLHTLNLEATDCSLAPASQPVVSPSGRMAAWTCLDLASDLSAASGVVVRVSSSGIERYAGVPMTNLAIDDNGDLLLYSVESIYTDEVDGVAPTSRPRTLFALSRAGVLTRVDELEPAPAPVLLGASDIATYIQGAALD